MIVLRCHAEALHELTIAEWYELGILQQQAITLLHGALDCEKEYVMGLAEAPGFHHIHFHVVAKPYNLPPELVGTRIFAMLKVSLEEAISSDLIVQFCQQMCEKFASTRADVTQWEPLRTIG